MSNPLADVIPAKHRKLVYAVVFVASVVMTAVEANGGDWRAAVLPILTTLSSALSYSNTQA